MNEIDIIKGARAILADEKRWTKGQYADRFPVDDETAVCMLGALGVAYNGNANSVDQCSNGPLNAAQNLIVEHIPGWQIHDFNDADTTTHADVLTVFDKVLADLGAL